MQEDTPLLYSSETASRMAAWSAAVARGEKASAAVYPKPSDAQLRELEHLDNYYAEEDLVDAKEEEKRRLTKGNAPKTEIQKFYKGQMIIEKLLRSCGDIENIFVLLRSKKGKDTRTRLKEIMDDFVTVIINAAATVKFDEKLSAATAINVRGTRGVIGFAKECKNLKALTHISTAFYEPPMSVEALEAVAAIDEGLLEDITPKLLGKYPNTYCFTKAVAEEAVRKFGEGMPICIVRPSIEKQADMVPVDLVVNAVLAATQTSDIPIYNFVSGAQNPQTWGSFMDLNQKHGIDKPTTKAWRFTDHGVRAMWGALDADDRVVFPFNIAEMSWDYHAETFLVGLRVYLVKDDLSTLPEARKKWTRLYYLHQSVKLVTLGLLLNLAYIILRCLVRTVFG
ncbi:hypothetical protein MSG28_015341 [Choristoneura fumiferana]|uniref:Uncharacterized protein n=1 Tax=Choristoneura fumiferana TaxID=7141 RepID=A0ACC0KAI3_CHOFU|nr:hypothetical protein MSG28_015341 [Choristoneura fumiferana]